MKIYVMRHGTTVWNQKRITQGRSKNRLSREGKAVTQEIALKYKNIDFDIIFSSPLVRTIQTANIMNQYHNVKIIKDDRLIEIDQGVFTGRSWHSLTEQEKQLKSARDSKCGMESYESVYKRVEDFISQLKEENKFKNVLIITHDIAAGDIADVLNNIQADFNKNRYERNFKNAEIKCFDV